MNELTAVTSGTTSQLVALALNAASARHVAIAQNIANVHTEGYQPLRVDFEQQIAMYKDQLLDPRYDGDSSRVLETLQPAVMIRQSAAPGGDKVELDSEVGKMVQNTLHYEALLAAQGKMMSLMRMAVTGGR